LDTCHLFASGYDIRSAESVEKTLQKFDEIVGLRELKVVHLNDSKGELNSNLDRHQHIGLGSIGLKGMGAFLNHDKDRNLPLIMETPIDETRGDKENLKAVLALVK
jgi:deoxyribonuclease-4